MVTFPKRVAVQAVVNSETVEVSTEGWSEEFIVSMFQQGWKIRMDRATASDKTDADKVKSRQAKFDAFCKGDLGEVGAGGGPRQSVEEKGEIDWLNWSGLKVSGKEVNGKNLQMAMMTKCREALLKAKPELENATDLNQQVQAAFPTWRAAMREKNAKLADFIRIERESREVKSGKLAGEEFTGF